MYYVYILLLDEMPIYAGMTNNPINRFRRHYMANDCRTHDILRWYMFAENKLVTMKVVYCSNDIQETSVMEQTAIKALATAGFKIINSSYNRNCTDDFPRWKSNMRTPHKIFTEKLFKPIRDNIIEIHKEYGYE